MSELSRQKHNAISNIRENCRQLNKLADQLEKYGEIYMPDDSIEKIRDLADKIMVCRMWLQDIKEKALVKVNKN